jgi:iron complex transport system substrate-binding protein
MREPDAIIEFHAGESLTDAMKAQYIADWEKLPSLPAVRNGRICLITESHALRPGPRVAEIAAKIAGRLHPDAVIELGDHGQTP